MPPRAGERRGRSAPSPGRLDGPRLAAKLARTLAKAPRRPAHPSLRAYLGSPLPVRGVRAPEIRRIAREFWRRAEPPNRGTLRDVLRALWAGRWFEERAVAIEILVRAGIGRADRATWRLADRFVDTASGWALSDSLASGPISRGLAADPRRFREILGWTGSPNLWRRRAAAYAMNGLVRSGELDRPFVLLDRLARDPERWVQRAVGTWLRECGKVDGPRTERFLFAHVRDLAPVAITVATERSSPKLRAALRDAHARPRSSGPRRREY